MNEVEASLDKEIEQILIRAIEGKEMQVLYLLDMKALNEINEASGNKFDSYIQQIVSSLFNVLNLSRQH